MPIIQKLNYFVRPLPPTKQFYIANIKKLCVYIKKSSIFNWNDFTKLERFLFELHCYSNFFFVSLRNFSGHDIGALLQEVTA